MRLEGSLAVVTGASSGIGEAAACALGGEGARVVGMARGAPALDRLVERIEAEGGKAFAVPCDVGDPDAVATAAGRIAAGHGAPDILVLSAGAGRFLFADETSPAELVSMTQVPYHAAFFVTKAFLAAMVARGSGAILIVNVPTVAVWPGALGYFGARYALRGLAEGLRADLRGTGLDVITVNPGNISTPYSERNEGSDARLPKLTALAPQRSAHDVALVILRALRRGGNRDVYYPFPVRLMAIQGRLLPRLTAWLLARTGASRDEIDPAEVQRSAAPGPLELRGEEPVP